MPTTYITAAERYVLSFIADGRFDVEDRQLYHDHVSPRIIQDLLATYDYEDALTILDYVIDRVETRHNRAKERRRKYELACYLSWLKNMRGQVEADYAPKERHAGFVEAIQRYFSHQAQQ